MSNFREFETKYECDPTIHSKFKYTVEKLGGVERFLYCQGEDTYYTKDGSFVRYRRPEFGIDGDRAELTVKVKSEEHNNYVRKEVNLRVDENDESTVDEFLSMLGYSKEFNIWKSCHVYWFNDAVLSSYDVREDDGKIRSFVEIEVVEHPGVSVETAWQVIAKYESVLGMVAKDRVTKSLYEMYTRPRVPLRNVKAPEQVK